MFLRAYTATYAKPLLSAGICIFIPFLYFVFKKTAHNKSNSKEKCIESNVKKRKTNSNSKVIRRANIVQ